MAKLKRLDIVVPGFGMAAILLVEVEIQRYRGCRRRGGPGEYRRVDLKNWKLTPSAWTCHLAGSGSGGAHPQDGRSPDVDKEISLSSGFASCGNGMPLSAVYTSSPATMLLTALQVPWNRIFMGLDVDPGTTISGISATNGALFEALSSA